MSFEILLTLTAAALLGAGGIGLYLRGVRDGMEMAGGKAPAVHLPAKPAVQPDADPEREAADALLARIEEYDGWVVE